MAYNYEYPYTDSGTGNMDWILSEIKRFENALETIKDEVLDESKKYIDSQIGATVAQLQTEYMEFTRTVNTRMDSVDSNMATFTSLVNGKLAQLDIQFAELINYCESILAQSQAYTQQSILNNNAYIIDQASKALLGTKVVNYFTGETVTIQEMFDYLCHFHLENAITYAQMATREKTYTEWNAMNMTYTDLAIRGADLFI